MVIFHVHFPSSPTIPCGPGWVLGNLDFLEQDPFGLTQLCVCCCFRGLEPGSCWNMSMSPIFGCLGALRENQKQQAKQGERTMSCWCERQAPAEFLVQHEVYTITRLMQVWLHGSPLRLQSEGGEVALSQAMEEASRLNNRPVLSWA